MVAWSSKLRLYSHCVGCNESHTRLSSSSSALTIPIRTPTLEYTDRRLSAWEHLCSQRLRNECSEPWEWATYQADAQDRLVGLHTWKSLCTIFIGSSHEHWSLVAYSALHCRGRVFVVYWCDKRFETSSVLFMIETVISFLLPRRASRLQWPRWC